MSDKYKILLSSFIGSDNLGDEVLAQILISNLSKKFAVTVLTKNYARTVKLTTDNKLDCQIVDFSIKKFIKSIIRADCLVLGAGGILNDESSILSLLKYYLQVLIANKLYKKPVFLVFVGVGPIKTRLGSALLGWMSAMVEKSFVRDRQSAQLLAKHSFNKDNIVIGHDLVFSMVLKSDYKASKVIREQAASFGEFILFCPRDWFYLSRLLPTKLALKLAITNKSSNMYKFRYRLIELLETVLREHKDINIAAVPFYMSQDLSTCQWIKENIASELRNRYIVSDRELLPDEYIYIAKQSQGVIGIRLHSIILALIAGKNIIGMAYSSKVKSLMQNNQIVLGPAIDLTKPDFEIEYTADSITKMIEDERSKRGNKQVLKTHLATMKSDNEQVLKSVELTILDRLRSKSQYHS